LLDITLQKQEIFQHDELVGAAGFEPATFWSQTRRATRLRYAPLTFGVAHVLVGEPVTTFGSSPRAGFAGTCAAGAFDTRFAFCQQAERPRGQPRGQPNGLAQAIGPGSIETEPGPLPPCLLLSATTARTRSPPGAPRPPSDPWDQARNEPARIARAAARRCHSGVASPCARRYRASPRLG
jgi:hypothetical protein